MRNPIPFTIELNMLNNIVCVALGFSAQAILFLIIILLG